MSKILIVEDNEMNRDMLTRRLERKGFETEIAINGEEALSQTKEYNPDIILMDMSLPVMDGWEATRHLKQQEETKNIPIVGLSAHAREVDVIRGKDAGCDAYETKPVDLERLINTIEKLL
ncbi:MAG: two-component system response regulator [endosymbiont of Galathealinum brachiosum]|uniref:Two-component system response regulator n=1 Tax=endosymbiont of Galathealinum brachiosum TaxID=2200906 RepID=A0A370DBQ6_9GAMM|nr:MAG: two-component system response regulator [endosymbiont of Galathealinum brachiosum]